MWQATYEELEGFCFTVITVALDKSAEDARPWIEAARPAHPSLIDTRHTLAELYNIVNVPTVLWIDEKGRIVRPHDVAFATDTYKHITGLTAEVHLNALRTWVRGDGGGFTPGEARAGLPVPTASDQQARAEFGLAQWLFQQSRPEAAERHFIKAGELAPHDFTIRRGSMPMRGIDPMGPQFREMLAAWVGSGRPYYKPLPQTRG